MARRFLRQIIQRHRRFRSLIGFEDSLVTELAPDRRQPYQVVVVNWPSPESRSIGVLTSRFRRPDTGETLATVFVPDIPNVTEGQIRIVSEDAVVMIGWTVAEFGSFVLSYGVAAPDRIEFGESLPSDE